MKNEMHAQVSELNCRLQNQQHELEQNQTSSNCLQAKYDDQRVCVYNTSPVWIASVCPMQFMALDIYQITWELVCLSVWSTYRSW